MGKKAKVIIVILSMLVFGLIAFIVTDKFILNKDVEDPSKTSSKNNTDNTSSVVKNNINEEENKVSEEKNKEEEKLTPTTVNPAQTEAVKKALKDKEWLANNVLVQDDENYNDVEDIGMQVVNFIVCKSNDKIPIVVIQVSAEDIRYSKIMLVTYSESEGKVIAQKINGGHIYHGAYTVDANKCVVNSLFMHGGSEAMLYHSVANGQLKFIGGYGSEDVYENGEDTVKYFIHEKTMYDEPEYISKDKYDEYKASLNESQYNFVEIGTELNDANVDKYIK